MKNMQRLYYGFRIIGHIPRVLIGGGILGIALAIVFGVLAHSTWVLILCWALGIILLVSGVFWHLSMGWINDREKIEYLQDISLNLLKTIWDGRGKVLDIGTGLGRVAIEIARRFPEAEVIGTDTWTRYWRVFGMTKEGAERNAVVAGVSNRCTFQYGDATYLPFNGGEFQLVVSSFAFHEVRIQDKIILFKEVLRVLAPGGCFGICDFFPKGYKVKNTEQLLDKIRQIGAEDVRYRSLKEVGVNLGGLSHIWGIGYVSGRKTK